MNINNVRTTPCEQCPFARTTPKEYLDTRGYNGDRFTAQSHMSALLPCHMDNADGLALVDGKNRQCAGAAIFRTHIKADIAPQLATLPEDHKTIFSNEVELIAHHAGVTLEEAKAHLENIGLQNMIMCEVLEALDKGLIQPI